jgi:Tol biopolymer transport system component
MTSLAFRVSLALVAVTAPALGQQAPAFQRLLAVDSTTMGALQASPDDKWIVYVRIATSRSLWIVPAAGGPPARLTSDGFQDQVPHWFPGSDRVVFASNRPVRNGENVRYAMVLSIDAATGRAVGVPRQVTTEPIQVATPSADGRSVVYLTPQPAQELKIVPATGGTARTLARLGGTRGVLFADKAGRSIYVRTVVPDASKSDTVRLYRVPVTGGQPELLLATDHLVAPLPADPRYVVHFRVPQFAQTASGMAEVRTVAGQRIAEISVPRGVSVNGSASGGSGFLGIRREGAQQVRVVPIENGEPRTIATRGFPEAWMPDSKAIIADRPEGAGNAYVVDLIPLDGGRVRTVPIPASSNVTSSGWNSSVGPYFSMMNQKRVLTALDVRSGQTRVISQAVAPIGVIGRGGMEQDGRRWVYFERASDRLELRSTDPATGESRVIRSFPSSYDVGSRVAVNGSRIAVIEPGKDSLRVVVTTGATGQPRRIVSFPARRDFEILSGAWSWDSTRLAVSYIDRAVRNETVIAIFDVPVDNTEPIRRRDIRTGSDGACYFLKWLPDASGIIVNGVVPGRRQADIMLIPTNGSRPRPLTNEPLGVWEGIELSPDGRHVAYYVSETTATSVWKLDLRPIVAQRR